METARPAKRDGWRDPHTIRRSFAVQPTAKLPWCLAIASLWAFLDVPFVAFAQEWTAQPMALTVRDAMFDQTKASMHLLRALGDSSAPDFVLIRRVPLELALDLNVEKALREIESPGTPARILEASRGAFRTQLAEQLHSENTSAYWYVFGSAPSFTAVLNEIFPDGARASPEKGHVIRASQEDSRLLFSSAALHWSGHPLRALCEKTGTDLLIVDGPTDLFGPFPATSNFVRTVLHVNTHAHDLGAVLDRYRALQALRGLDLGDVAVLDLLPSAPQSGKVRGQEDWLLQVESKLSALLSRRGVVPNERARSADAVVEATNAAARRGRRVFLFATTTEDGGAIDLQGGKGGLVEADVRRMDPSASFIAVFWARAPPLPRIAGWRVLGRVGAASSFLRVTFRRDPLTGGAEFVDLDVGGPNSVLFAVREVASGTSGNRRSLPPSSVAVLCEFNAKELADALRVQPSDGKPAERSLGVTADRK